VFAPWPLRNLHRFGAPHLLGSSWVTKQGDPLPTGVQTWLLTWATSPQQAAEIAWKVTKSNPIPGFAVPPEACDSPEERKRLAVLFDQYNAEGLIAPAVDEGFEKIARERRQRDPVRFFLKLPLRRVKELWAVPVPDWEMPIQAPSLGLPDQRDRLAPLNVRTLILAGIGLLLAFALPRGRPLVALFLTAAIGRTIALAFIVPGGTQRYMFELLPMALVFAALALLGPAELLYRKLRGMPPTDPAPGEVPG